MQRFVAGLIGGIVGTAVMTGFMRRMHRALPPEDQYPLPPRQITMSMAAKSGIGPPARETDRTRLTLAAHYAYGTGLGAMYGLFAPNSRWAPLTAGVPFGLAVWAGSYLGWLPATGLHPPATEEPAPRNALMIAAHLVWAGTMAAVVQGLASPTAAESTDAPW